MEATCSVVVVVFVSIADAVVVVVVQIYFGNVFERKVDHFKDFPV